MIALIEIFSVELAMTQYSVPLLQTKQTNWFKLRLWAVGTLSWHFGQSNMHHILNYIYCGKPAQLANLVGKVGTSRPRDFTCLFYWSQIVYLPVVCSMLKLVFKATLLLLKKDRDFLFTKFA